MWNCNATSKLEVVGKTFSTDMTIAANAIAREPLCYLSYEHASKYLIDDYWKDRIERFLSGLVRSPFKDTMNHYHPTVVVPYETEDGLSVSDVRILENSRHDFRIEAAINGKIQKYIAGRKSDLASEIRHKGRDKMRVDDKKSLVARLLLPLARRDMQPSS